MLELGENERLVGLSGVERVEGERVLLAGLVISQGRAGDERVLVVLVVLVVVVVFFVDVALTTIGVFLVVAQLFGILLLQIVLGVRLVVDVALLRKRRTRLYLSTLFRYALVPTFAHTLLQKYKRPSSFAHHLLPPSRITPALDTLHSTHLPIYS